MVTTLKKGISKLEILKVLKQLNETKNTKGVDTQKYCGKIKLSKDPLEIQNEMRNEW